MSKISPDMVNAQLERILASSDFLASKRHSQFLRYVVEHSLNGKSGTYQAIHGGCGSIGVWGRF